MPSIADMKSVVELGLLTVTAFSFIALAVWGFVQLKPVIANNTRAIETLVSAIAPVKDFAAHEERSRQISVSQHDTQALLEELTEKVATREEVVRIHTRIDEQCGDIKKILGKVGC